ncbi:SNF2-related protein [Microbacterium lemovicicum]|uniref:SNF2-related protein n=1 Tax=Microbacterium lemovicicum TaxID=1072463 RepID=UPI00363A85D4
MSADWFPQVEELTIARLVGALSFSRGKTYADSGRVSDLTYQAAGQVLSGLVKGSADRPYQVRIALADATTSRPMVRTATCTCPIAINCKHAAAVLTAAAAAGKAARTAESEADAGWRGLLAAFGDAGAGRDAAHVRRPLALQFEPRRRTAGRSRWGERRDEPAKDAASVDRLAVRPVTSGQRGGWIKSDLTWQNVGFQGAAGGYDPAQAQWFGQLAALKGATALGAMEHGSDWIALDVFESPLLWAHLAEAPVLGIALVGTVLPTVSVVGGASVGFDAHDADDALTLSPVVVMDGEVVDAAAASPIGGHGVYVVDFAAKTVRLSRLSAPLSRAQRAILERPQEVAVDAADRTEFLRGLPALSRTARILSSDGTFEPPAVPPATLVLSARFERDRVLRLDWRWELAGERRVPLAAGDVSFLDPATERAPAARAAELLATDPTGAAALAADGALRPTTVLHHLDAAEFSARLLPEIERLERVRVEVIGEQPAYREIEEAPTLVVRTVESERNDWFELGVMVQVEGRIVPFGPLFKALSKGAAKLLLVDSSYLSLKQPVFDPLRQLIEEAGSLREWETGARISRYQATLMAEFEDRADESPQALAWRRTVDGLADDAEPWDAPVPAGFQGELRPYQVAGFRWLAFLHRARLGGILADDMGLGKTAQTLALIQHAVETDEGPDAARRPFLVVAPTSVVSNWAREAARFVPGLRVVQIDRTRGKSRRGLADRVRGADIVLTTYAILRLDAEEFASREWAGLILDEAQFAKNAASKVHEAAQGVRAPFRLAVTGTPIENNLGELWALLALTAPGLFPSRRAFDETYRRPIEVMGDEEKRQRLRRRIRPFLLRRTKEQVVPELPPKQEQVLEVPLHPEHRRLYDTHLQRERQKILGLVADLDRNRFTVYRSLTLLRLMSLDAALVDPEAYADVPSAKLDALLEQLEDVLAEGHQALVFSQFTSFLRRAAARVEQRGTPYAYLDGTTRRREEVIDRFRSGEARVFFISLKAGGFGLNLTEADYVFLLDPWWNPATEAQAVDRTHRIGQERKVMVYRLVSEDTIEQKVMALKEKKAALVSSVLDDEGVFSEALNADDIRGLLGA